MHLLTARDITDLDQLIALTDQYYQTRAVRPAPILADKILATLFFEPSTRTRFSFESAMYRLGGQVLSQGGIDSSSLKKGESLADMGRMMSYYADAIVIRHPVAGSVDSFASYASVPVINAGDGASQHPTQSLVDLYTIYREANRTKDLKVGFLGDLKYGRTVHSLAVLLDDPSNTFFFISPPDLAMPQTDLRATCSHHDIQACADLLSNLDILYVTRMQVERLETQSDIPDYWLTRAMIAPYPTVMILHPLPRKQEIDPEIDSMPNAKYFQQAQYGLYVRMGLLAMMLTSPA